MGNPLLCVRDFVSSIFTRKPYILSAAHEALGLKYGKAAVKKARLTPLFESPIKTVYEVHDLEAGRFALKVGLSGGIGRDVVGFKILRDAQKRIRHPIRIVGSEALATRSLNFSEFAALKTDFADGRLLFDYILDPTVPPAERARVKKAFEDWTHEMQDALVEEGWEAGHVAPDAEHFPKSRFQVEFDRKLEKQPQTLMVALKKDKVYDAAWLCLRFDCNHPAIRSFREHADETDYPWVPLYLKTDNLKVSPSGELILFDPY